MKVCTLCLLLKDDCDFHSSKRDGLKSNCKSCIKKTNAVRYLENKSHINATSIAWQVKNKDRRNAKAAEWRKSNPEKVIAASKKWRDGNLIKAKAYVASYAKLNKSANNERCAKRRSFCLSAQPKWADKRKMRKIYLEAAKRSKNEGTLFHVDHIVPLRSKIVCGLHVESNMQILKAEENSSKGNRYWPDMP